MKKEVYIPRQLRELYAGIKKAEITTIRSIDINRTIKERLNSKVRFCEATCESRSHGIQSEYVLYADENFFPDAINAILTGEGIKNYMQLKAAAYVR